MAGSASIGGLVSGLDTKTLISQLMSLEAAPQKRLQTQLTSITAQTTAVRSLNTKAASLTAAADALLKDSLYSTTKSTSSSSAAAATVTGTPAAGSVTFSVIALAAAHRVATGVVTDSATAKDLTIVKGGVSTTVAPASGSLADQVKAINDASVGVTASLITDGDGSKRMLLSSSSSGADSTFEVLGLTDDTANPSTVLRTGSNAQIDLGGGITLQSKDNSFPGLVDGVSITVSELASDVTVVTAKDSSVVSGALNGLVASMNSVLTDISFHSKQLGLGVTPSSTNGGLLAGNGTLRGLGSQLLDTISGSVGADAATRAGLSVTRAGEVTFDQTTFDALNTADPAAAKAVLTAFAAAVKKVGDDASNGVTGSLTGLVTGNESTSRSLTDRIADWTVRLDLREESLNKKYSALEVALGRLQSQSDSLAQTLASLSPSSSS